MLSAVLLSILMMDPVEVIKLQNNGMYLSYLGYNQLDVSSIDGSILGRTKYQLWHWDRDGKLMRRFGQKGGGPGEVEGMGVVYWSGDYYWVIDNQTLRSSLFDGNGRFLSRRAVYFRQFIAVDNQLFGVDYGRANQFLPNYPRNLQEIHVAVEGDQLQVDRTDLLFYKVTQGQQNMVMNFKLLWVVREGDTYLVVNQVEPHIYMYDAESRRREADRDILKANDAPFTTMLLPFYVPAPDSVTKNKSRKALIDWMRSWSRINYFGRLGQHYVVAYEVPGETDENSTQAILPISREGKPLARPLLVEGAMIGVRDNRVLVFREGDNDDSFEYFVDVYDLAVGNELTAPTIKASLK